MKAIKPYAMLSALVPNRLTAGVMDAWSNNQSATRPADAVSAADAATDFATPRESHAPSALPSLLVPSPSALRSPWAWLVPTGLAVIVLIAGFAASRAPLPIPLTLLSLLAVCGLFALLAMATGRLRLATRAELPRETIADAWPDGVLITTRLGLSVYANRAFEALLPATPVSGLPAMELWLTGQPTASEALFRLIRAGERGEARSEEVETVDPSRGPASRRTYRIGVAPLELSANDPRCDLGPLVLWRLTDITPEQQEKRRAQLATELRLDAYDSAPAGLVVLDTDHRVVHMNATVEQWLGLSEPGGDAEPATLEAVFSGPGAEILRRNLARYPQSSFHCPLDMAVRAGRRLPIRVLVGPPEPGEGPLAGNRVLAIVRAEWADGLHQTGEATDRTFHRHYQAAPFGIATVTESGHVASANGAFATIVLDGNGGIDEPVIDVLCRDSSPEQRAEVERYVRDAIAGQTGVPVDFAADAKGTAARRLYAVPLAPSPGSREAAILYLLDTSEQRDVEAKLAQAQKMEAIGKLAGEMAHNFNNVLTAIIGSAELMMQTSRISDPAYKDIQNIRNSALRAAELVNQLMSFSRQQTLRLEVAHLGEWLAELRPMIKTAIGEKIDLQISSDRDLWYTKADRSQIQQVLMNFASNSRDAMPGGGTFKLFARNVAEREVLRLPHSMPVAEYVVIEAHDTGSGMPPEVMAKIFDPFYTTKDIGKGTGLGLASVYGIVKQLSGFVFPESTVGEGTIFRIYLPRAHPETDPAVVAAQTPKPVKKDVTPVDLTGTATVLIVEDEDMVRSVAVRQLVRLGYRVLEAGNGCEALTVIEEQGGKVDIVISDVVMPEMDGPSFMKAVRVTKPDLKIIFVSGHTNEAFRATIGQDETFAFLQKPFSLPQLALKVKEELAR